MRIATIGRGTIGGGLAKLWRNAGHDVTELGRDGGDVSEADVVLVAVPGDKISDALAKVTGIDGKTAIDSTNIMPARRGDFRSYAEEVKSITRGPVAKSSNMNFGQLLGKVREQRVRPSNWYVADDEAVEITETLIRDAGFEPARVGDLSKARSLEDAADWLLEGIQPVGQLFYRFAKPGEL